MTFALRVRSSSLNAWRPDLQARMCSGEFRYLEQACADSSSAWEFRQIYAKALDSNQMACQC